MDRRTALKKTGVLFGTSVMISPSGWLMQSCMEKVKEHELETSVLEIADITLLNGIVAHLIPDKGVPEEVRGAIPLYIDGILAAYSSVEQHQEFKEGIKDFNADCESENGNRFVDCSTDQQLVYLKKLESVFVQSNETNFYGKIKQWVFEAFFQTEFGITNYLDYNPMPGTYFGCVPLEAIGKIQHNNDAFKL